MLLGVTFVTLLVTEPTQASAPPGVEPLASAAVLELRGDRAARTEGDGGPVTPAPRIPDGMRVGVALLGIDLPLLLGETVRDAVLRSTPSRAAFVLPTSAVPLP